MLSGIDSDADGTISGSEASAHVESIRTTLRLTVDGRPTPLRLAHLSYPDAPLLMAGGGVIAIDFNASTTSAGVQNVRLTSTYAPASQANGSLLTKVQANLTPDNNVPIEVRSISHPDDGRTLAASYALASAPHSANSTAIESTSPAANTSSSRNALVRPGVAAATVALIAVAFGARRRRPRRSDTPNIAPISTSTMNPGEISK